MKLNILFAFIGMVLLIFTSCNKDEDNFDPNKYLPVLDQDFYYTVDENDVLFTTTLSGDVWFTNVSSGTEYSVEGSEVTVKITHAGTYPFTCNVLVEGVTYSSDTFNVFIEQDDLSFLESGYWLYLTGGHTDGVGNTKTWRMDMDSDAELVFFDSPLYFSGTTDYPYWSWDVLESDLPYTLPDSTEMTTFFNWKPTYEENTWLMVAEDYGTIAFNGVDGTVSTTKSGVTENGQFSFDPETMKLTLTNCIIPIDAARLEDEQFEEEDLYNLRIYTLKDSIMQIGIKRSYEGGSESKWTMIYNFIVDNYDYPPRELFIYTEPIRTSITVNDLVGTWKYDEVAQNWIGWEGLGDKGTVIESKLLNGWVTREEIISALESWGASNAESIFTENDAKEFVFNADGTCTLAGIENTYSVSDGVITFSTSLTNEFSCVFITLTGTTVSVLDVKLDDDGNLYNETGIWIGQRNGNKYESSAVHLVKQ